MMILNQKKVKLEMDDTIARENPDSTSIIHLTAVKVAKYRQVADNRREKQEAKKATENKTTTIKVHLQLKISEIFDTCINSMNSLSLSTTYEESLIQLIQKLSNTIKDAFVHIGGKLAKQTNQRSDTAAREII